jgi:hypothetical protein
MFAALAEGASHPAVAAWLAVGTAGVAAVVVAMAWSVNARQIRLAELLARRQFLITSGSGRNEADGAAEIDGGPPPPGESAPQPREGMPQLRDGPLRLREGGPPPREGGSYPREGGPPPREGTPREGTPRVRRVQPEIIEGPEEVVAGEQARYRVQTAGPHQVVSWAVGGGAVSHAPDPGHRDDLLLIADQPGDLTIIARVREGLTERRATKSVTVVPEVTEPRPPFTLRLFLHGWGLVVVAVLIVGFAGALDALGNFTSSDFIALAVPLAALLGVIAVARGASETGGRPGNGKRHPLG